MSHSSNLRKVTVGIPEEAIALVRRRYGVGPEAMTEVLWSKFVANPPAVVPVGRYRPDGGADASGVGRVSQRRPAKRKRLAAAAPGTIVPFARPKR